MALLWVRVSKAWPCPDWEGQRDPMAPQASQMQSVHQEVDNGQPKAVGTPAPGMWALKNTSHHKKTAPWRKRGFQIWT